MSYEDAKKTRIGKSARNNIPWLDKIYWDALSFPCSVFLAKNRDDTKTFTLAEWNDFYWESNQLELFSSLADPNYEGDHSD